MVVDLNAFDEGLYHYIRDEDHVVLPHMIISDLAGNERRDKHANCLPDWLKRRGGQIWVAHDWVTLEALESSPNAHIADFGWRDDEGSNVLRRGCEDTPDQWRQMFRDFESSEKRRTVEDGRRAFLYGCQRMGEGMKIHDPDLVSQIKSSQCWPTTAALLIREPIMGHMLGLMEPKEPRYRTQEWHDALGRFPDEKAIGRMSRMMCWYSIRDGRVNL